MNWEPDLDELETFYRSRLTITVSCHPTKSGSSSSQNGKHATRDWEPPHCQSLKINRRTLAVIPRVDQNRAGPSGRSESC